MLSDMGSSLSEYTENLTTKAIRLQLKHADIGDDGMYECYQETFSGKERLIGSQIIRVDCMCVFFLINLVKY